MNILRIGRNVTIIALLVSLLFHISTIFYIFLQKTHKNLFKNIDHSEQNIAHPLQKIPTPQQNQWVTTQARAGNFGSPVFFEDLPEETDELSTETSTTEEEPITQENAESVLDQPEFEQEKQSVQKEQPIKIPAAEQTHRTENNNVFINTTPAVPQQPRAAQKKTAPHKKRAPTGVKTNGPKPPITLAQLTQGFLAHSSNNSGSSRVSMIGMKTGRPSHEQLKYDRYLEKLEWCFQNSFNINRDRMPPLSSNATVYITLAINRDGTVKHIAVSQSSGNIMFDKFILFLFKDASSSFPPIPQYLPDDPFTITCIVPVSISY